MYVGTTSGGLFKTTNGGSSWTDITGNLPDVPTNAIEVDFNGPGSSDDIVYVGSANLDVRSLRINFESVLRLNDPKLAAEAVDMFNKDLEHCRKIDPRTWRSSRTLWGKLREDWAYFVLAKLDPYLARLQVRILRK